MNLEEAILDRVRQLPPEAGERQIGALTTWRSGAPLTFTSGYNRMEFFNLPNHVRFSVGTTGINSTNFGQASTIGSAREIQLNGRLNF